MPAKVRLKNITTGIPGLDAVLGGGFPEFSFNIIAGEPGSGKTTLIHQFLFANATTDRPALYFTALGERPIKMVRYQQQMSFFDLGAVGHAIRFVDLAETCRSGNLDELLAAITLEVSTTNPAIVVFDSFKSLLQVGPGRRKAERAVRSFLQQLALRLTSWQVTSFLLGEHSENEVRPEPDPLFTVCDCLLWLFQSRERNAVVRKLQVKKMRGQAPIPGLHSFRISDDGLRVFPRIQRRSEHEQRVRSKERVSTGIRELDTMMSGGIPLGDSLLVAGPTGVGKTTAATQFVADGLAKGEPAVVAVFEEHPDDYLERAEELGFDLRAAVEAGQLKLIYLRPLALSIDETLLEIRDAVEQVGAKRFVMDSISGFELALAPDSRDDFRESLYRLVGALTGVGVTTLLTVEVTEAFTQISFSPHSISFLSENIILLRYVELEGKLQKLLAVVKMRRSRHSHDLRAYDITPLGGIVVNDKLRDFEGLLTGVPTIRVAR